METHTVRSHGATLARTHRHDWLILILLMALVVMLHLIHPFKRFVGKDMMDDLRYPLKDNTIPVWAVPVSFIIEPKKKMYPLPITTVGVIPLVISMYCFGCSWLKIYQVYAVLLPIIVFLFFYSRRHDVYDLHHAILGNETLQSFSFSI